MFTIEIPFLDLEKMYHSGQQFSWSKINDNTYSIVHTNHYVEVSIMGNNFYKFSCSNKEFQQIWHDYFDIDTDYESIWNEVIKSENQFIKDAAIYGYGIRILKQDQWETIITFLISQNNNMKRIRRSCDILRDMIGTLNNPINFFPTAEQIVNGKEYLKDCGLGYREEYIKEMAQRYLVYENDINKLSKLNDNDYIIKSLIEFKGIGNKVASCIGLYGFHRLQIAPIDTHMKQIINNEFKGVNLLNNYPGCQGLIQQWLFDHKTNNKQLQN